jgi:NADH:ubiquinone oxidoreductase subunit F (NADH-binding)
MNVFSNTLMKTRYEDSFYHLGSDGVAGKACQGMACFVARHLSPKVWRDASGKSPRVYCLGKCYAAPAASTAVERPSAAVDSSESIVLKRIVNGGARSLTSYIESGGYQALTQALKVDSQHLVNLTDASALRGRGGAGFPAGKKWRAVQQLSSTTKYVIANADEGDPGAYIDRFILEDDPHCLIEAMIIAGRAVGASEGYIYLRNEYPEARAIVEHALGEARQANFLGANVLNQPFSFDIKLVIGRGSYICGEETALIRSIEGKRSEVMPRPPYPTAHGLFGQPTLVNNVETLASIPWIVLNGAERYRKLGHGTSRGTKVVSLNSLFNRPGLYEIEFGIPLSRITDHLGGGLRTGKLKGLIIGGPLAGVVPPDLLDTRFGFDELRAIGASVGHGGVVAFDDHTSIGELIHHIFSFGAYESCGKCTPCRLGNAEIERIFKTILEKGWAPASDQDEWRLTVDVLAKTSLCAFGTGLAEFAESALRYYGKEINACFQ